MPPTTDNTLSGGALSLREERTKIHWPPERFHAKFLDVSQQLRVVLEPLFRFVVPLNTRRAKSENRRSITGGVAQVEF